VLEDVIVQSRNERTGFLALGDECTEGRSVDRIATQFSSRLAFERWARFLGGVFVRETSR